MAKGQGQPTARSRRQKLREYEPGAYLFAPYVDHMKGGLASLTPVVIAVFATQPFNDVMTLLATFGFVTFIALATYCAVWALMSKGLLHAQRLEERIMPHAFAYAIAGAVANFVFFMLILLWVQAAQGEGAAITANPQFDLWVWLAPTLGAAGSVVGLLAMQRLIGWYVDVGGGEMPDALKFEPKKRDRDEWEQL